MPDVKDLVKLPVEELKRSLDAYPLGDERLRRMMQADIDARRQISPEYAAVLQHLGEKCGGSSW